MQGKTLTFGDVQRDPDIRELDEMRGLLLDREYARDAANRPLYYMYRDLFQDQDQDTLREHALRYDITVIPAGMLGREYVKTKGHYHPVAAQGTAYPELYEVIAGTPHFLLQRKEAGSITDVVVVTAEPGDKVIIPPGYGHITINPGDVPVKMANWVSSAFESIYGEIEANRGGAYYETIADEWVRNPQYDDVPPLRTATPSPVPDLGITKEDAMYPLIRTPDRLAFLNRPHKFQWVFDGLY